MSLRDEFFQCAGELRSEQHKLPTGQVITVGEVGGDEWLEIEDEAHRYRVLNGVRTDPLFMARIIVRSCTDEDGKLIFKRPVVVGDHKEDEKSFKEYEDELRKILRQPRRVFAPLRDVVDRVNFADDASFEALKKKSAKAGRNGSTSSPETPAA